MKLLKSIKWTDNNRFFKININGRIQAHKKGRDKLPSMYKDGWFSIKWTTEEDGDLYVSFK